MPDQLQLRGGTTSEHSSFTGAAREVTVDTTKKTLVVHDGSQAGGTPLMKESGANAAAAVAIGTGGNNAINIDSNQRVGIGTADFSNTNSFMDDFVVENTTAGTGAGISIIANATNGYSSIALGDTADKDAGRIQYNHSSNHMDFHTNGTGAKLTIDDNGSVGIGTTSPNSILNIKSSNPDLILENTGTGTGQLRVGHFTNGAFIGTYADDGGSSDVLRIGVHSGDEAMRIDTTKNVIVGGTSAQSSDAITLNANGEVTAAGFYFSNNIGAAFRDTGIRKATTNTMVFDTASGEKMRLDSNGQLGIGTSSPARPLEVNGGIRIANDSVIEWGGVSAAIYGSSPSNVLFFKTSSQEKMRLDSNGQLGIGTTTPTSVEDGAGVKIDVYQERAKYHTPQGKYGASLGKVTDTNTAVWVAIDSGYNQTSAVSAGIFLKAYHLNAGGSGCGFTIKNVKTNNDLVFSEATTGANVSDSADETEKMRVGTAGVSITGNLSATGSQIDFTALPTSDPNVAGRLWRDGTDLKVSVG